MPKIYKNYKFTNSNGDEVEVNGIWCCDCRNGEHENYDDDVVLCVVRDPDTKKLVKRGYLCQEHRRMYEADGFEVRLLVSIDILS